MPLTSGTKILTSAGEGRYSCRNIDACCLICVLVGWFQAMRDSVDDIIIGQSAPIKELKKLITVVAEAPTSVLVLGETGTGKELVRAQSMRRQGERDVLFR